MLHFIFLSDKDIQEYIVINVTWFNIITSIQREITLKSKYIDECYPQGSCKRSTTGKKNLICITSLIVTVLLIVVKY